MATERRFVIDGEAASRSAVRQALGSEQLNDVFSALLNHQPAGDRCPNCGTTRESIEQTGLVGCPLCYAIHEGYLLERFGVAD